MMYVFNFTCNRDQDLSTMMITTMHKHARNKIAGQHIVSINTDYDEEFLEYGCGAGWKAGLMKLQAFRGMVLKNEIENNDWLVSVDSDVLFTSGEVFEQLDTRYGIIGIQHQQPYDSIFGKFGHMSGCLIFFRGDIAKKIASLSDKEIDGIRFGHFKPYNITENEDVMLSYFAKYVGAESFDLGSVKPALTSGNFEQDLVGGSLKSFYHLNYNPETFLGEIVGGGKWLIPSVLKNQGIYNMLT